MSKHTKEPWRIGLCGADAETFPIESGDGFVFITDAHPEDARRIVACVNACAGISTEVLEQGIDAVFGLAHDMRQERNALVQQRDELLKDMEEVFRIAKMNQSTWGGWMRDHAQKSIAKVKP